MSTKKKARSSRVRPAAPKIDLNALRLEAGKKGDGWCGCKWKWGDDLVGAVVSECAYHADLRAAVPDSLQLCKFANADGSIAAEIYATKQAWAMVGVKWDRLLARVNELDPPPSEPLELCVDCRHRIGSECWHPNVGKTDIATGKHQPEYCTIARTNYAGMPVKCGPSRRWFEPKGQAPPPVAVGAVAEAQPTRVATSYLWPHWLRKLIGS